MKKLLTVLYTLVILSILSFDLSAQWEKTNLPDGVQIGTFFTYGSKLIAGSLKNGVFVSSDNGTNWVASTNLTISSVGGFCVKSNKLFAGTNGMGVVVSTDQGLNWTETNNGLPSYPVASPFLCGDDMFAWVFNSGIYRSTDEGANWSLVSSNLPDASSVLGTAVNGNTIYAFAYMKDVYSSSDRGETWTKVTLAETNPFPFKVFVNEGVVYVYTMFKGTLYSTDNGATWNQLPKLLAEEILTVGNNLIGCGRAGSDFGVFSFRLNDTTLTGINAGLPEYPSVRSIGKTDSYLFCSVTSSLTGNDKNGVYRVSLSQLTSVYNNTAKPQTFALNQNYPNPFNPSTTISYSLPEAAHVKLTVYDVLGSMVTTLVDEYQTSDNHSIVFDANGLSSGIYYYRIEAGKYSSVRKLILMK